MKFGNAVADLKPRTLLTIGVCPVQASTILRSMTEHVNPSSIWGAFIAGEFSDQYDEYMNLCTKYGVKISPVVGDQMQALKSYCDMYRITTGTVDMICINSMDMSTTQLQEVYDIISDIVDENSKVFNICPLHMLVVEDVPENLQDVLYCSPGDVDDVED